MTRCLLRKSRIVAGRSGRTRIRWRACTVSPSHIATTRSFPSRCSTSSWFAQGRTIPTGQERKAGSSAARAAGVTMSTLLTRPGHLLGVSYQVGRAQRASGCSSYLRHLRARLHLPRAPLWAIRCYPGAGPPQRGVIGQIFIAPSHPHAEATKLLCPHHKGAGSPAPIPSG